METSGGPWRLLKYPLIEMGWRRGRCIEYLHSLGINAPKSACVFCPFHSNKTWKETKAVGEDWARVLLFEKQINTAFSRHGHVAGLKSLPTLHRSREPIATVDFDGGQLELFGGMNNECSGVCGV